MVNRVPYVLVMSYLPTQTDLSNLGVRIAHDGFEPHEDTISEVVFAARRAGASKGIVSLVADPNTPPTLRARAYDRLVRDWAELRSNEIVEIDVLLQLWNAHEDLRVADASIADLSESRRRLDEQRTVVATNRRP